MIKIILGVLCFVSAVSSAQTYNSIDQKTRKVIDSTYNALIKKNKVVGTSIALVQDGEIIYANGYGFQDKENEIAADENTIYRIGSCTKSFTALSVMQLQEKKKLDINNAIQDYVAQINVESRFSDENPIRIKDILTHSSGLPSDILNGFFCDNPPSVDWLIEQLNKCTMSAPAGYQHSYSNLGYSLLEKLITEVSEESYEEYLKAHIFSPLNMNSSFVSESKGLEKYISKGYMNGKEFDEAMIRDKAAGLIYSNVVDMAKYLNMYLAKGGFETGQIATEASISEMEANALVDLVLKTSDSWGYGLYSHKILAKTDEDTTTATIIGHGGDTWAFHADFKYIPELNVGAVILTNSNTGGRVRSADRLLKLYLKETKSISIEREEKSADASQDKLCTDDKIRGRYYFSGLKMNVEDTEKIKIKQGSHRIILTPKNDSCEYSAKLRLFGFVPIKVRHQEFKFVNYNDDTYFKLVNPKTKNESYMAIKSDFHPISEAWKSKFGNYELVGDFYPCKDCPRVNFENLELELTEENGILVANLEGKSKDTKRKLYLDQISDEVAVTVGLGRNSGETVRILDNGNLFYSGFEFQLTK